MINLEPIKNMNQEERYKYMLILLKGQLASEKDSLANISNAAALIFNISLHLFPLSLQTNRHICANEDNRLVHNKKVHRYFFLLHIPVYSNRCGSGYYREDR